MLLFYVYYIACLMITCVLHHGDRKITEMLHVFSHFFSNKVIFKGVKC